MRDKWDSRRGESTYGAQTIAKALERSEFYEDRGRSSPKAAERADEGGGTTRRLGRTLPSFSDFRAWGSRSSALASSARARARVQTSTPRTAPRSTSRASASSAHSA